MYFVFCPLFVSKGVLFNDLAAHYSGAELAAMQARYIGMFQAGWFVESMWSQTLVIHMIRTPKLPFIQSRASAPVTLLTMTGIAVLTVIPFTPFGAALGLVALPVSFFPPPRAVRHNSGHMLFSSLLPASYTAEYMESDMQSMIPVMLQGQAQLQMV